MMQYLAFGYVEQATFCSARNCNFFSAEPYGAFSIASTKDFGGEKNMRRAASYDVVMEQWANDWLSIVPCAMTTVTANVRLPLHAQSIDDARRMFFSPPKSLVEAIENAPYGSAEKKLQFLALQKVACST